MKFHTRTLSVKNSMSAPLNVSLLEGLRISNYKLANVYKAMGKHIREKKDLTIGKGLSRFCQKNFLKFPSISIG
jgi:hypothetical protein